MRLFQPWLLLLGNTLCIGHNLNLGAFSAKIVENQFSSRFSLATHSTCKDRVELLNVCKDNRITKYAKIKELLNVQRQQNYSTFKDSRITKCAKIIEELLYSQICQNYCLRKVQNPHNIKTPCCVECTQIFKSVHNSLTLHYTFTHQTKLHPTQIHPTNIPPPTYQQPLEILWWLGSLPVVLSFIIHYATT